MSISRLPPNPGRFSTAKPVACSASRTGAATLHVASVACGAARRDSERITWCVHISGFDCGEYGS